MNWLDIVILILCGLMVVWGASKGIIGILFSLLATVAAVLAGSRFGPKAGETLIPTDNLLQVQTVVGYFLVFVTVFIVSAVAAGWISRILGFVPLLGPFNRLTGAAVGLLVGVLLSFSVVAGLKQLEYEAVDETIADSTFGSFIIDNLGIVAQAARLIPQDWDVELKDRTGLEKALYIRDGTSG